VLIVVLVRIRVVRGRGVIVVGDLFSSPIFPLAPRRALCIFLDDFCCNTL
jgi:hypothetical protein